MYQIRRRYEQIPREVDRFMSYVDSAETDLSAASEAVKALVDVQLTEAMQQLVSLKSAALKDIESRKERLEMALLAVDNFGVYCEGLKQAGGLVSAGNLAKAVDEVGIVD